MFGTVSQQPPGYPPQAQGYGPPPGYGPQPGFAQPPQATAAGMKRSPLRVAILLVVATLPYYAWWMWQFMSFGRKEHYPRAKAFWWTLIPIYGFVVIYRAAEDQANAEAAATGRKGMDPRGVTTMIGLATVTSVFSNKLTSGVAAVVSYVVIFAFYAAAGYMVQASQNRYVDARYPGSPMRGISAGEIAATVLGLAFMALIVFSASQPGN